MNTLEEDSGRLIEIHGECFLRRDPSKGVGFVIETRMCGLPCPASVVEEEKVFAFIEFRRVDGILNDDELYVFNGEIGFFVNFPTEGIFGRFTPFDLASGNAPLV